jgi:hypothetical protein
MSSNDSSSDLDSRISAIVESTVGRMRDELLRRMQDTEARLRDITGRLQGEGEAAGELAAAPEPAGPEPVAAAPTAPSGDAGADLFDAVLAMDRSSSQQEVLAALLEGVGSFATRSALFLTRADIAKGWGSYGFDDSGDIQQVELSYGEGPLAVLAEGRGCVALTGDDCATLCRQMGAAPGAEGLLVPFVLRDRLAAALYLDRFAEDPPLGRRSLQLLAYVGAQAVEGLALRQRADTPTLKIATEAAEAPGVALWEAPQAAATAPAEAAPAAVEPAMPEAPAPAPAAPEPTISEPHLTEPRLTEAEAYTESMADEVSLTELADEVAPADLATAEPAAAPTMPEAGDDWQLPALPTDEPAEEPMLSVESPIESPVEPTVEPLVESPVEPTVEPVEPTVEPTVEPPVEPPPPAPAEAAPLWAAPGGGDLSASPAEATPQPGAMMPPAEGQPAGAAGESTEVQPPTDVSGPGWAFTASRAAAETGDEAQHEEARRLARLLVTEIKLYNEEQVEEGRRGNDIYARLREDIDRSRQIFNERVDEAVRQENDYFHEEMVRILGGGNAEALGI